MNSSPGRSASRKRTFAPNTVREKLVPLLKRVFVAANEDWPSGVRVPARQRPVMHHFEPEELAKIVQRIRESGYRAAERHADLVELLALTGMRLGELAILRRRDLDPVRMVVTVRARKGAARSSGGAGTPGQARTDRETFRRSRNSRQKFAGVGFP